MKGSIRKNKIFIRVVLIVVIGTGLIIGGMKLATSNSEKLDSTLLNQMVINAPNLELGSRMKAENGIFGGKFIYKRYKDIDGYIIPWTDVTGNYSVFGQDSVGFMQLNNSNGTHDFVEGTSQKMMKFYNQDIAYKKVATELKAILGNENLVMEVAISFDKTYSLERIRKMTPENLNIAWLWLDEDDNGGQLEALAPDHVYGFEGLQKPNEKVPSDDVYQGNYNNFLSALEVLQEDSAKAATLHDKYSKLKLKQLKFKGMVLTGQATSFKNLSDQKFIRASEIGATADIVPYIKPYK
ncbi:hypothetical protein HBP99_09450 [Listeria booriae]|uniref:anti sigma factor C-terminal domain-containing protein n=1 Tax=Listeria booriae TaxID=1552123 RepID=UPI001623AEA1|nr:anti sigma factor C-terminal domain-containing protein [Listeria booriae]MBC2368861.1 hypothetical protein [Listeria booriae]